MCGFVGYISNSSLDIKYLKESSKSLIHRGPDDAGILILENGKVGMAHRRLSIIDLSVLARQPMSNHNKILWIVYNGEIYNFKEIRKLLINKGYNFISNSDTEVILYSYEEWGEDCLEYFCGMFAFAIYDMKKRLIFATRDRVGKKPFYYFFDGKNFAFASELKALTFLPFFKKEINPYALADYLSFGYIPAPKSIWSNAFKLLPGEYLVYKIEQKRIFKQKYWQPEFNIDDIKNEEYWLKGLKEKLYEAVKLRTVSDVPIGAFLSGGVDSSTVVAILSQICNNPATFTISFNDERFNESPYASKVAEKLGCYHIIRNVTSNDAKDVFKKLLWHYDEPFNDYSYFPTYYVCRETSKYVKVALSGDGGDEIFCGYNYYGQLKRLFSKNKGLIFLLMVLTKIANHFWPLNLKGKDYLLRISKGESFFLSTASWLGIINKSVLSFVLMDEWIEAIGDYNPIDWLDEEIKILKEKTNDLIGLCRALDFRISLPERMLTKVDRVSMANSIEVRNPFLDHKLIEFASKIPIHFLINFQGHGKLILKKLAAKWILKECLYRKKHGFGVPLDRWFIEGMQNEFLKPFITGEKGTRFIKPEYLKNLYTYQMKLYNSNKLKRYTLRNKIGLLQSFIFLENWADKWL